MLSRKILHLANRLAPKPKYWPEWLQKYRQDIHFYKTFGRHINWDEPKTFNEKIQWQMMYFEDDIASKVSDKITFKDYVREKLGEGFTAKLLGVWESEKDIDFSALKPPYVLKSNCSGDDRNMMIVTEPIKDEKAMRKMLKRWLNWRNTNIYAYAHAYYRVKPKIFAEEYMGNGNGDMLTDYKFYCFNGEPYCVYSDYRPRHFALYDLEWNVLDVKYSGSEIYPVPKPAHFDDMVRAAKILSKGFPFVRVDFYDLEDGIKAGELTYDSSAGVGKFEPESFDYKLGEQFRISRHSIADK